MQSQTNKIAIKYLQEFCNKELFKRLTTKKETIAAPTLAMTPTVAVDIAKDTTTNPSTASTIGTIVGWLAFGGGTFALGTVASPIVATVAVTGFVGCCIYQGMANTAASKSNAGTFTAPDTHSSTATTTSTTNAPAANAFRAAPIVDPNTEVFDPVTQFIVHPNDPRYAQLKAAQLGLEVPQATVYEYKENKKPSKEKIAKQAAKEAQKSKDNKDPEEEDDGLPPFFPSKKRNRNNQQQPSQPAQRKINPPSFKQDFKNCPRVKENYEPTNRGTLKLKDRGIPLKDKNGRDVYEFKCDHSHNDIEMMDKRGNHLGSMDPITLEMYKDAVYGRRNGIIGWLFGASLSSEARSNTEVIFSQEIGSSNTSETVSKSKHNQTSYTVDTSDTGVTMEWNFQPYMPTPEPHSPEPTSAMPSGYSSYSYSVDASGSGVNMQWDFTGE